MANEYLVSAEWLHQHLGAEDLKIVDCQWDENAYLRAHIPGAFMRPGHPYIKSEKDGKVSKFLPERDEFLYMMEQLGIARNTTVICYDEWSNHFATRFWWVAQYYGFNRVKLLNGGWQAWLENGFPVSCKVETAITSASNFQSQEHPSHNISMEEVKSALENPEWQILDVRSDDEYAGRNLAGNQRGGHLKGAIHLEWDKLLALPNDNGVRYFLSPERMEAILAAVKVDRNKKIIVHCQSGVRASFTVFCLNMLSFPNVKLYDGSMGEWANEGQVSLETED